MTAPAPRPGAQTGAGAGEEPDTQPDDEQRHLDRTIGPGQLASTARHGLLWTLGGQWAGFVVQLLTGIVLARLLTPRDFGLVGLALTLTVFVDQFRTMGLSQAVIQRDDLTLRQVNALFWVNSAAGVALTALVMVCAPLLAAFYGEPQLVGIVIALSGIYVLSGLAVQPNALLARTMSFRALAVRGGAARLLASVAAITAALLGAGYWALVVQQVALALFMCILVWFAVRWRPGAPRGIREASALIRFGAGITLAQLANTVSRNGDNILIGKFVGTVDLGLYTRAYSLLMLPISQLKTPLGAVMQPMLAAVRSEPSRYRRLYCTMISGLSHLGMPIVVGLAVCAEPLLYVLLGPVWTPAARIFQFLALAGVVQMVTGTVGWLPIANGDAGRYARFSTAAGACTLLSFVVGLPWGAEGVAAAYAAGQALIAVPAFWYCSRGTSVTVGDIVSAMIPPLVSATAVGAAMLAVTRLISGSAPWQALVTGIVTAAVSWALVLLVWPRARREVFAMASLMRAGKRARQA